MFPFIKHKVINVGFLLLFLIGFISVNAQNENNIWYFGTNAGLDFNSGSPIPLTNGALISNEGCASICDSVGNLLFYTNGVNIWNSSHLTMNNGTGLIGHPSASQSSIIVKKPGSSTIYYVFTVDDAWGTNGNWLAYSEVDMALQSGLGAVTSNKNITIVTPVTEKVTVVKHQNNIDYWIITHLSESKSFLCYLLTSSGLSMIPIVNSIGVKVTGIPAAGGYLRASPDGTRIANTTNNQDTLQLFDFNNATGVLSNPITMNGFNNYCYGVEFSPNGKLLYVTVGGFAALSNIYQYNLQAGNNQAIINSKTVVGVFNINQGAIMLGPDSNMYIARWSDPFFGVISEPDSLGLASNYIFNGQTLGGQTSMGGLPNYFWETNNISFTYDSLCYNDSTHFSLSTLDLDSVLWNFGDISSGVNDTSTNLSPVHLFSDTGIFVITLISFSNGISDTTQKQIYINPYPSVNIGNDTTLCQGTILTLNGFTPFASYLWQDNSGAPTFNTTQQGNFWVEVTVNNCTTVDTINVTRIALPIVNFGNDTTLCQGDTFTLDVTNPNATYLWQDNSTDSTFNITQAGTYWVQVIANGCSNTDTINVNYNPLPNVNIGNDTTLCPGEILFFNVVTLGGSYLWQNNSTSSAYNVSQQGTYWVEVTVNNCSQSDTINVNYVSWTNVNLGTDTSLCQGDSLLLNTATPNSSYLWQDNSSDSIFTVTQQGTYWVQLNSFNCLISDTINVNFITPPLVNLGNDTTLCQSEIITLNGTYPNSTYVWQDNSFDSTLVLNQAGTYWVETTNICGIGSDTININYNPLPLVNLGLDTNLCLGDTLLLDVSAPNTTYLWQDNTTNPIFLVLQQGNYWVQVTENQCSSADTINILYSTPPFIDLGLDVTICDDQVLVLDASFPSATYLWHDNSINPTFSVIDSGSYFVLVTNFCGASFDSVYIEQEKCKAEITMTNVFTPNGDGSNDLFLPIQFEGVVSAQLLIFNRWGQQLFYSERLMQGWDGRTNTGIEVPSGTYFWVVNYVDKDANEKVLKGHVSLLRD